MKNFNIYDDVITGENDVIKLSWSTWFLEVNPFQSNGVLGSFIKYVRKIFRKTNIFYPLIFYT